MAGWAKNPSPSLMPTKFIQRGSVPLLQDATSFLPPNVAEIGVDAADREILKYNSDGTVRPVGRRDKSVIMDTLTLTGSAIHGGVQAWTNPEAGSIVITRAIVDVTTVATAAAKLDIGTTASSSTTASDNLLDGIDVHSGTGLLGIDDGDAPGAGNGKHQQKLAAGKWVTVKEISGDATGLVGVLYIYYSLV